MLDHKNLVVKIGQNMEVEAFMLKYLKENSNLPVPDLYFYSDNIILMSFIDGNSNIGPKEQKNVASIIANLHGIKQTHFGFNRNTLIGSLLQKNNQCSSWIEFYREYRLLDFSKKALKEGSLESTDFKRIENFCSKLTNFIGEPKHPSLIHGDLWTSNMLFFNGEIKGFVDPAIYYADPEIELAFSTMFNTFGSDFFEEYQKYRPLDSGFFKERRDIYLLFPLLVHIRLFGGSYVANFRNILKKFGF